MKCWLKLGGAVFISLRFPGNVASHPSTGSCSQMEFAFIVAPAHRESQAAFAGRTANLGALLATPVTQLETNELEHWDTYTIRTGSIGLLYASTHPHDICGHCFVLSCHPCRAVVLALLPSQFFCGLWMVKMESDREQELAQPGCYPIRRSRCAESGFLVASDEEETKQGFS